MAQLPVERLAVTSCMSPSPTPTFTRFCEGGRRVMPKENLPAHAHAHTEREVQKVMTGQDEALIFHHVDDTIRFSLPPSSDGCWQSSSSSAVWCVDWTTTTGSEENFTRGTCGQCISTTFPVLSSPFFLTFEVHSLHSYFFFLFSYIVNAARAPKTND